MANDKNIDSCKVNGLKLHSENRHLTSKEPHTVIREKTYRVVYFPNGSCEKCRRRRRKIPKIRRVNAAIHVEPLIPDGPGRYLPHNHYRYPPCRGHLIRKLSKVHINRDMPHVTRYQHEDTFTTKPISRSNPSLPSPRFNILPKALYEHRGRIESRASDEEGWDGPELERYSEHGGEVHITASLTAFALRRYTTGPRFLQKQAYLGWFKKKDSETLEKKKEAEELELKRKAEEERLNQECAEKKKIAQKNFDIWLEKKKEDNARKKMALEKHLKIEREISELAAKLSIVKDLYLDHWYRKKNEERKAQKQMELLKWKELQEKYKKKFHENSEAFKKWQEEARNRPRAASYGLLPSQQPTPGYCNPVPWVFDDVEIGSNSTTT